MAQQYGGLKKKPVGKMLVYGALSGVLYAESPIAPSPAIRAISAAASPANRPAHQ